MIHLLVKDYVIYNPLLLSRSNYHAVPHDAQTTRKRTNGSPSRGGSEGGGSESCTRTVPAGAGGRGRAGSTGTVPYRSGPCVTTKYLTPSRGDTRGRHLRSATTGYE